MTERSASNRRNARTFLGTLEGFPFCLSGLPFLPNPTGSQKRSTWPSLYLWHSTPRKATRGSRRKKTKRLDEFTSFHSLQRILLLWAAVLSWHWDSSTDLVWAGRHACPDSAWPMPLRSSASFSSLLLWEARPELLHSPSQPLRCEYSLSCKKGNETQNNKGSENLPSGSRVGEII